LTGRGGCGIITAVETESGFFVSSPETRKPNIFWAKSARYCYREESREPSRQRSNGGLIALMGVDMDIIYTDYLKSAAWMLKREQTLKRWDYRCTLCYGTENLEVHHRTYIRLGDELPTDLIVLCDQCHERHHEIMGLNDKLYSFWLQVYKELDIVPDYY
jgi:hypothetical protein